MGLQGVLRLAPISDAVVIVDVLTFRLPWRSRRRAGRPCFPAGAGRIGCGLCAVGRCVLAGPRGEAVYSLSPASLMSLPKGGRIVLPSPNGATLSLNAGATPTFAGCLRNARSVAAAAGACGPRIAVIACGERWPDGGLRPSLEDQIGAGAVLAHLDGVLSPEAAAAVAVYESAAPRLLEAVRTSASGKELAGRGFEDDVAIAAESNVDDRAPGLRDGAFRVAARG